LGVGERRPRPRQSAVPETTSGLRGGIVGRDTELLSLHGLIAADAAPGALVLSGGPGIGKTKLWEAGVDAARERGVRVLSARASDAEAQHSFATLIDLFDDVSSDELAELPGPQLEALDVALLRVAPTRRPPQAHAIGVGLLNALRALAARERLIVAVDDVQWLDRASANALVFAARRLEGAGIGFLLARRPGQQSDLEQVLEPTGLERVVLAPLSIGAIQRILSERLGLQVPRHLLRRIVDTTLGNPLFALEVGRMLAERGPLRLGEDLPLPDSVEGLLGTRVATLPGPLKRLLLAVALSADLRRSQLAALGDPDALAEAVDAGVLLVDGDRVRASHPLLAAAALKHSRPRDRRELHSALAETAVDDELCALHRALATELPDADLAKALAAAAVAASARAATAEAVVLAENALRLTPDDAPARTDRLLALAGYLRVAGEKQRVTDLLAHELDSLPPGEARVRACLLLTNGVVTSNDDIRRYYERALAETGEDPQLRAHVLARMSENEAAVRVERIREAEAWAQEALRARPQDATDVERTALYALGWARSLRGRPIGDVCERFLAVTDAAFYIGESPERVAGQRLVWRGDLSRARAALMRLLSLADEHGEPSSYALVRLHVCELELRAGHWDAAAHLLDEWAGSPEGELLHWPMYERCRALVAAGRGLPGEAEAWGAEAIVRAETTASTWDRLEALRALGIADLLAHRPAAAAEKLRAVWEHTERAGVDDPGAFPVAPDLVEALAEVGELDEARAVTARLRERAEHQGHPWAVASARRCAAVVELASAAYDDGAAAAEQAADEYAQLGLRFDGARTLLSLGRAQRRGRKWGAARATLERAVAGYDEMGSPGWAEEARAELARVGARRPSTGELTPTERRVAELAADGLANKEIAQALVVTVNTVEFHLRNTYAKLGIRSRVQLVSRLAGTATASP
jgi:DNA-binding NarL/FixJ family response regulator